MIQWYIVSNIRRIARTRRRREMGRRRGKMTDVSFRRAIRDDGRERFSRGDEAAERMDGGRHCLIRPLHEG